MSLEHGHVDEVVHGRRLVADLDGHAVCVVRVGAVLLQVHEGHVVAAAHLVVARRPEGQVRPVAHPGALHDGDVLKTVLLQIFHRARQQLGVGGGAA